MIILICFFSFFSESSLSTDEAQDDCWSCEIYSAVMDYLEIEYEFAEPLSNPDKFFVDSLISGKVMGDTIPEFVFNNLPEQYSYVINAFKNKNTKDSIQKCIFVDSTRNQKNDIISKDYQAFWEEFIEKYSEKTTLIYFSQIGYNNKKNEALLMYRLYQNREAEYCFVLMKKKKNKWRVQSIKMFMR